jgi:methyltransferase (TIGR00027 family)
MINGKASMTAQICAFARAYHSKFQNSKIFNDYLASEILTDEEFEWFSEYMINSISYLHPRKASRFKDKASILQWVMNRFIEPITLARSRYVEDSLEEAIKQGVEQYVILGAGLDTFAFRKKELLKKIDVFEVDHPDTQNYKLNRIKDLGWNISPALHFIPVDFSREYLSKNILKTSFDPNKKTLYSWVGVTYYLTRAEITNVLQDISSISCKGSIIIFDYADKFSNSDETPAQSRKIIGLFNRNGESIKTGYDYCELFDEMRKLGFEIHEHISTDDIEELYYSNRTDNLHALENINYVLAVVH